jgi:hypothetical protein
MHNVDAELHVVRTVPSQQLIEDSREIMFMLSEAVSVWPWLSVSFVISVMVGKFIGVILMIEIFVFFLFYGLCCSAVEFRNVLWQKCYSYSSLGFIGGTDEVKRAQNLPPIINATTTQPRYL